MKKGSIKANGLLLAIVLLLAGSLGAVETSVWQVGTFSDFLGGQSDGVSINENGELGLAPEMKVVFSPEAALALSLASGPGHRLYVGTGHQGKVFRVDPDGKSSLFFTASEPDIFALAAGPDGDLYAGSSPDGKIYRITPDGKSSVFFDPHCKYIWALIFDSQGNLYAGTGDQGKIYRINSKGEGRVFYDSNQTHIMSLALDQHANLLAGSVPDGLIYRISPQGKAFVLYQADLPEIHAIETDNQGRIFVAALGAGPTPGIPGILHQATPVIQMPTQVMTVTVTGSAGINEEEEGKTKEEKPGPKQKSPPAKKSPSFIRPTQPATARPSYVGEKGRGELIEILPNSTIETLWSSNQTSPYGLAIRNGRVLFSTSEGDVFELNPADHGQDLRLIGETHESLVNRLLLQDQSLYLASSDAAKLFRMEFTQGHTGTYISSVKDTRFISQWGHLTWQGEFPPGSSVDFFTRTGNSQRPDSTWSDWEGPLTDADGSSITNPPARYIQWKAVLHGSESASPLLDEISLSYLNQNVPPAIHSLNVSTGKERTNSAGGPSASFGPTPAIDVVAASAANLGASVSPASPAPAPLIISWQADDPNGDTLDYSVYAKSEDEHSWHLLKKDLRQSSFTIEPDTLPDGKYEAKVVASDLPSNPPSMAEVTQMISAPFWVDSTPPSVAMTAQRTEGGQTTVRFEAQDSVSPIISGEYRLGTGAWTDIMPENGIADSTTEDFAVRLAGLQPGEHVVIFRAYDSAGNAGLGKAVVQIAESQQGKH